MGVFKAPFHFFLIKQRLNFVMAILPPHPRTTLVPQSNFLLNTYTLCLPPAPRDEKFTQIVAKILKFYCS